MGEWESQSSEVALSVGRVDSWVVPNINCPDLRSGWHHTRCCAVFAKAGGGVLLGERLKVCRRPRKVLMEIIDRATVSDNVVLRSI